jgi:hypothetical protein
MALPRRTFLAAGSLRSNRIARALAFVVALLVMFASLSAEAKKKKPAKKHKPAATKSKGKEAAPEAAPETDEASDEKSSGKGGAREDEEEDKPKATPAAEPGGDEEAAAKKPAKAKSAPEKAEAEGPSGAPFALKIGVGGRALFRQLRWTDDGGALAPYTLSPGPEVGAWLEAYPAAFATDGFAANIGLVGRFNYGFGASSKTPAGQTLTTKYQDFLVGLKIRIPLGMVLPYVQGAYGMQKFHLEPADATRPNFNYGLVHAGGGALFQVTPELDIDVGAGFVYVMNPGSSAGEIKAPTLYPRAAANGVDVSLSVGYRIINMIGVRVGGDFRQFGIATGWRTGDAAIRAGGATDRNITVWGGVEVVFDAMGGGGETESAPDKKPAAKPKKKSEGEGEEGGGGGAEGEDKPDGDASEK